MDKNELDRCKDPVYFFEKYFGVKLTLWQKVLIRTRLIKLNNLKGCGKIKW